MGDRVDPAVAAIDQDGSTEWDRTSQRAQKRWWSRAMTRVYGHHKKESVRGVLGVARPPASVLEAQFNFER